MSSGIEDQLDRDPLPAQGSSLITATISHERVNYITHCVIGSSNTKKLQLRGSSIDKRNCQPG